MTAAEIAAALGARPSGSGRWMARCPAHPDRRPSMSIAQRGDSILIHCFAGCPQEAVIDALKARGLWPERRRAPFFYGVSAQPKAEPQGEALAPLYWFPRGVLVTEWWTLEGQIPGVEYPPYWIQERMERHVLACIEASDSLARARCSLLRAFHHRDPETGHTKGWDPRILREMASAVYRKAGEHLRTRRMRHAASW